MMVDKPRYHGQFGNLVGLRPIKSTTITPTTTTITKEHILNYNNNKKKKNTKTMKISEQLHQRFLNHSRKYYEVETYETIQEDLLDCFDKHNEDLCWWMKNNNNNNIKSNENTS
jgi:hypothetical protein